MTDSADNQRLSAVQGLRRMQIRALAAWAAAACLFGTLSAHAAARADQDAERLVGVIRAQAPNISTDAISTAISAYRHARLEHLTDKPLVTVVDYSVPSNRKRLAVADVRTGKVLFYTYVAHGKGSGLEYATRFSNTPGTDASSLGVYLTGRTYYGKHGYSLRLYGLEPQFNGTAYRRDIVVHSAWYVSKTFAQEHGRMGLSWGCFALSRKVEGALVNLIRGNTVLVGYYPDRRWLRSSAFLAATG
jgi:L,D-transpeptidase catalytic domain